MERRTSLSEARAREGAAAAGSWAAFLVRHCLAGMVAGWTTVGGLLWLDVAGLSSLVMSSDLFPLPLLLLLAFFGITFGSVAMGSAIMALGRRDAADGAGGRLAPTGLPAAPRKIDGAG